MKRPRSPHPLSLLFACVLILTLLLYPTVPSETQRSDEVIYGFTGLFAPQGDFMAAVAPLPQADGVLYVKPSASGSGDCSDWDNACTLQTALGRAVAGDEIWVAAGIHRPTDGYDETASFQLASGVALYGGFDPDSGADTFPERDWDTYVTVLSGDIEGNDITDPNGVITDTANINPVNSLNVVTSNNVDDTAVLDGFAITGGDTFADGAGMRNSYSRPTLTNLTFSGNLADDNGGGMYNDNSSPTLSHVTFSGNSARLGGGMCNDHSSPTLTDVIFSGNSTDSGGGMHNDYSSPTLTYVTYSGNFAANYGGGMANAYDSFPTLTNVTFSGNFAAHGGGMSNLESGDPTLVNVTFSGNSVGGDGGGMWNFSGSPTLANVTFSGNHAESNGGGMYNEWRSSPTLVNVTFSGNHAESNGGGMHIHSDSDPSLTNTILWGNTATSGPQIYKDGSSNPTVSYSDVQGGYAGTGNIDLDPLFVDADGPDDTPGTSDDDLSLQFTSPAVDKGDNAALPLDEFDLDGDGILTETLSLDLAGNPRISGFGIVDLGAYELDCFRSGLLRGNWYLSEGQKYRKDFHAELGIPTTISDVLASYAEIGLSNLVTATQDYEAALACAVTVTETEQAMTGLLNAYWESATGAMLQGNEFVVRALDVVYQNPYDPLTEEIDQLLDATGWYTRATGAYLELLASEHLTLAMSLQPTRVDPLDGQVTPYLDLERLALTAAKKSRAYLELAERQFRQFTPDSKAEAEATLRQGLIVATGELALLGHLWPGVANDVSYQAVLRNMSDMQRLFDHLQEGKNPFGYGPEFVPFHFDPDKLPDNNYEQTQDLADVEVNVARDVVDEAQGKQQESDDNWVILQQRLADVASQYDSQLVDFCGTDGGGGPDVEHCHENTGGEFYYQLLRAREASDRIQLVMQQMRNQNELIHIEQQRAAEVAGIQRATAELIDPETGEKYSDLMSQEKTEEMWATDQLFNMAEGCLDGMIGTFGPETILGCPLGSVKGSLGGLRTLFNDEAFSDVDQRPPEEKLLEFQAWQQAQVQYAEAEITDAESEALITQYMLRFAELDIEMSIAVNNLQQELARLDGMRTQVGYLLAEKAKAEAFTKALYQDPSGRVMRDYYMELADDRFDVALDYAYRAGRALEYEINWDPPYEGLPLTRLDDLYGTGDISNLNAAVAQMRTAYNDFLARPDVPVPQQRQDVIRLSQAAGFEDAYDPVLERVVTREEKFNAFVSDRANWVDLDGDSTKESLRFTFQTSIFLGNMFFATSVFNDKITSVKIRVRGENLGDDRAVIHLRQDGTSFIRTLNAFRSEDPYGRRIDDVREYNVAPLKASIMAATNENELPPEVAVNRELATRSVAFTNWTLTLDKVNEPNNWDVDIEGLEEIELSLTHEAYTLQTRRGMAGLDIFQPPPNREYRPIETATEGFSSTPPLKRPLGVTRSAGADASDLTGTYFGTVVISYPLHLPSLELTVVLRDTDGSLSGYIGAAHSLDFPVVDEASGRGPAISGWWSGDRFELQSEVYTSSGMTGTRQVVLHSGVISDSGETLTGVYSQTVRGLTPYPLTVSGDFGLLRFAGPEYRVYLPLVLR